MSAIISTDSQTDLDQDFGCINQLRETLNNALKGKVEVVDHVIVCLLARGHLLIEDRPGLGKTMLAKALASTIGGKFARVQCTPDLLPSDITGFNIFNQKTHEFEFRTGPVFSDVMLADEINRATPRTQSALLEAMAERQVTVDAVRYELAQNYFVIATQNPIDQHGTYPLPEAQLDRFSMKLSIGYPGEMDELKMLENAIDNTTDSDNAREPLFEEKQLFRIQKQVASIPVITSVQKYLIKLGQATRNHPEISLGLSPRGLLMWQRVAQAHAFLNQRRYVIPDDFIETAIPVLDVRLGVDHEDSIPVIEEIMKSTSVPKYEVPDP